MDATYLRWRTNHIKIERPTSQLPIASLRTLLSVIRRQRACCDISIRLHSSRIEVLEGLDIALGRGGVESLLRVPLVVDEGADAVGILDGSGADRQVAAVGDFAGFLGGC